MPADIPPGKRKSGVNPERSGHCKQGVRLRYIIGKNPEKVQLNDDLRVRKPAENGW